MNWSRRQFFGAAGALTLSQALVKAQSPSEAADLVLFNGKIVTVDGAFSIRQAIAIKDGRILAVGDNQLRQRYTSARSIDLGGRTVLPGFMDTHIHLGGHSRRYVDFRETKSLVELKQQIREKAKELGPGEWITGGDWDEYHFAERRKPLRADLDEAAPNNPVVLMRAGAHSSVGNSKALQLADINRATPNPDRGLIEKDAAGQPNGVIRERSDLYLRLVPGDQPQEVRESLLEDVRDQLKLGITSVIEAGATIRAGCGWLVCRVGASL